MNGSPSINKVGICKVELVVMVKRVIKRMAAYEERELTEPASENEMHDYYLAGKECWSFILTNHQHALANKWDMPFLSQCMMVCQTLSILVQFLACTASLSLSQIVSTRENWQHKGK